MLLFDLFITFFKIGLFTIGGGYAMIPLLQSELISKGWATLEEIINFIAISESTPGPFAINMSTFVGVKMAGVLGSIITTLGVVLPSFIIILFIAKYFYTFKDNFYVQGGLSGLRPAVIGLLCSSVFTIFMNNFIIDKNMVFSINNIISSIDFKGILILIIAFIVYNKIKMHPIKLIGICALLGAVMYSLPI